MDYPAQSKSLLAQTLAVLERKMPMTVTGSQDHRMVAAGRDLGDL